MTYAGAMSVTSTDNTTTTPLGASATYTGTGELNHYSDAMVSLKTDAPGTLFFDFSNDGTNWDSTFPVGGVPVSAGIHEYHKAVKGPRYFRVRLVNDSTAQTYLRLYTHFGTFEQGNLPVNASIAPDADAQIVRTVNDIEIASGRVTDQFVITRQGLNGDVDAAEDIWGAGGDYAGFPTSAAENIEVVSSSANDTSAGTGARTVLLLYMNDDYEMFDASGNFLSVSVTLNGTTPVSAATTGMRVWYAVVTSSGSGGTNDGEITIRWDTTTSVVFAKIQPGYGGTQITALTIPAGYTGYLHHFTASMLDNNANNASMAFKRRSFGSGTWVLENFFAISNTSPFDYSFQFARKYFEKTDIVIRCTGVNNANAIISALYEMRLQKNA